MVVEPLLWWSRVCSGCGFHSEFTPSPTRPELFARARCGRCNGKRLKIKMSRRPIEERNALVRQWDGLPRFVLSRRMPTWQMQINRYGYEDAVQVGYLGLIRAAELWEEGREAKFDTYAVRSIYYVVRQAVAGNTSVISVPDNVFQRSYGGGAYAVEKRREQARQASCVEAIGKTVFERLLARDDGLQDWRCDLSQLLPLLTKNELYVVQHRLWGGKTLREVGEQLGVTRERVRQVIEEAIDKLRTAMGLNKEKHDGNGE